MKPTKEDREAVWNAYWADPAWARCQMSRALHEWLRDGVMAFGAVDVTVRLQRLAEDRAAERERTLHKVAAAVRHTTREDMTREAAKLAIKVGEHEYARGRRDGFTEGSDRERGWKVDSLEDLLRLGVES